MSRDTMIWKGKTYQRVCQQTELLASDRMLGPLGLTFFVGENHARRDNILYYREAK